MEKSYLYLVMMFLGCLSEILQTVHLWLQIEASVFADMENICVMMKSRDFLYKQHFPFVQKRSCFKCSFYDGTLVLFKSDGQQLCSLS